MKTQILNKGYIKRCPFCHRPHHLVQNNKEDEVGSAGKHGDYGNHNLHKISAMLSASAVLIAALSLPASTSSNNCAPSRSPNL
ncbi:MAG: hypothetical protein MR704_04195 [Clostridia bacterium]|nr:hypothetical protein [Clostridia bacterium]